MARGQHLVAAKAGDDGGVPAPLDRRARHRAAATAPARGWRCRGAGRSAGRCGARCSGPSAWPSGCVKVPGTVTGQALSSRHCPARPRPAPAPPCLAPVPARCPLPQRARKLVQHHDQSQRRPSGVADQWSSPPAAPRSVNGPKRAAIAPSAPPCIRQRHSSGMVGPGRHPARGPRGTRNPEPHRSVWHHYIGHVIP